MAPFITDTPLTLGRFAGNHLEVRAESSASNQVLSMPKVPLSAFRDLLHISYLIIYLAQLGRIMNAKGLSTFLFFCRD
jgi:hypothetical protein